MTMNLQAALCLLYVPLKHRPGNHWVRNQLRRLSPHSLLQSKYRFLLGPFNQTFFALLYISSNVSNLCATLLAIKIN